MLPGKRWYELCWWKPSSDSLPSAVWDTLYQTPPHSVGETFHLLSVRGHHFAIIFKHEWTVETGSWFSWVYHLYAYLFIYLKEKKMLIFSQAKERTLIGFFTRDFPVDMNFINLSNKLCLVWWWGNNPLRLWITAEEMTNTTITLGFLIKILLPSIQFPDSRFLHSQLTPLPASQKVHCWQVLSIRVLVLSISDVVALGRCNSSEKVMKIKIDFLHLVSTDVKKTSVQCRNAI